MVRPRDVSRIRRKATVDLTTKIDLFKNQQETRGSRRNFLNKENKLNFFMEALVPKLNGINGEVLCYYFFLKKTKHTRLYPRPERFTRAKLLQFSLKKRLLPPSAFLLRIQDTRGTHLVERPYNEDSLLNEDLTKFDHLVGSNRLIT